MLPPKKRRTHNYDPLQVLFQLSRLPAGHSDRLRALLDRRQVRHRGRGGPHLPRPLHRRVRLVLPHPRHHEALAEAPEEDPQLRKGKTHERRRIKST